MKLARGDLPAEAYMPPLSEWTETGSYVADGLSEILRGGFGRSLIKNSRVERVRVEPLGKLLAPAAVSILRLAFGFRLVFGLAIGFLNIGA